MSSLKASLKVVLYAEKVVVAESEDPQLWQKVLGVINGNPAAFGKIEIKPESDEGETEDEEDESLAKKPASRDPLGKFATEIGVSTEELQAACDPKHDEPFLILDHTCWEAFKTQLGDRGPSAVAPAAAAATLLALWFKTSNGQANATQAQAQAVLRSINVRDSNSARGIRRSEWLQPRAGGQIILNPAKFTKAKQFARCFCLKNWTEWKSGK